MRLDEVARARAARLDARGARVYEGAVRDAWESYRELSALLKDDTHRILGELRHLTPNASEKRRKKVAREAEKKAIELARYVIPIAAFTSMVHTVSGIVLHRLYRMMRTGDAPAEARARGRRDGGRGARSSIPRSSTKVGRRAARRSRDVVGDALAGGRAATATRVAARLDALLGGRVALLVDSLARAPETTRRRGARRVRPRPRRPCPTPTRSSALLNPAQNRYRLETLNLAVPLAARAARCTTRATRS